MIIPPSDDALNAAWNDLVAGRDEPSARHGGIGPADAQLLHAIHGVASRTQPDAGFRDGLWAALSHQPAIGAPAPATVTVPGIRTEVGAMRPVPRMASSGRRWTSQIATIAAGLVIALVGYGALSLSGANPSGLDLGLNDVPNASAQGQAQAMASNPVIGTWAWLDDSLNANSTSLPIVATITLDAGGGVIASSVGDWTGDGTWTVSGDLVSVRFSVLVTQETLDRQGHDSSVPPDYGESSYLPNITVWTMSFKLSQDRSRWEDLNISVEMGVRATSFRSGSSDPLFFMLSDYPPESEAFGDPPIVRRLGDLIDSAPTISAQDAGLESAAPSGTDGPQASPVAVGSQLPTPAAAADDVATVSVQATQTAAANLSGSSSGSSPPTPTAPQVTVTPLPTSTTVAMPSPSS